MAKKGSSKRPAAGKSGKPPVKAKPSPSAAKKGSVVQKPAPARAASANAKSAPAKKPATKATTAAKSPVVAKSVSKSAASVKSKPAAPVATASAPKSKKHASFRPAPGPPPFVLPIQKPVATNDKPRKNQSGLHSRELEHFRQLLLEKRREIVGDMSSMEREALRNSGGSNLSNLPIHMADMGTDNYEQEFTLGLVEKDRVLLREINTALAKIQDGSYGICEGTGKSINKLRLEAQPWTRYSIEYARQKERGMVR